MPTFPTLPELRLMSLKRLRTIDISNYDEELLVQTVINEKTANEPIAEAVNRIDVPDIKTPEDEAKWQAVIDAREAKIRGTKESAEIEPSLELTSDEITNKIPEETTDDISLDTELDPEIEKALETLATVTSEIKEETKAPSPKPKTAKPKK